MTRPFNDELLSAYLDGELSAAERAAVEEHLATSAEDRELLSDLRSLRGELRALPAVSARPDFSERVLAAAVAAKTAPASVSVKPAAAGDSKRASRWTYWAAAAALAAAACVVIAIAPWRGDGQALVQNGENPAVTPAATLADSLVERLRSAVPGEGEAVVVRLRVSSKAPLGQALDMALAEAGILQRAASDTASGAVQVGAAYRQQVLAKHGITQPGPPSPELLESTVAAAEAVFVEATLSQLEQAVAALTSDPTRTLDLAPETKLAVALPQTITGEGEGESGSGGQATAGKSRNFSQRLNAGMFRLEKRREDSAPATGTASVRATTPVRMLILVEHVDE